MLSSIARFNEYCTGPTGIKEYVHMSACVRSLHLEVRVPYVTSGSWALGWPCSPRRQVALPSD